MSEVIILPPGVSIAILAFLLSLLPAALFIWVWYLRRHDRSVPGSAVAIGFTVGLALVIPAYFLEKKAPLLWEAISPSTAHYFNGAIYPLLSVSDVIYPAIGTFLIVALVEEGVRYIALWLWFRWSKAIDQVFDGLVIGLAAGLGFATLENTLYFFDLFQSGNFDTLVFVFFLRFLVSTLAHISFGGIMGALIAQGVFSVYQRRTMYMRAFLIPWFIHGVYDWLLGVNLTVYAVLLLLAPLFLMVVWSGRRDFLIVNRKNGRLSIDQELPDNHVAKTDSGVFERVESPWNTTSIWLKHRNDKESNLKIMRSHA